MLKESLEKLDKDVMNLLTYSVNFVQASIEFVSNNQGYKQKKKSTNSHQNKRKEGNICIVGCELFYRLWPQEEDELLSSYSFAWLLTGDFRLAKGDVKRISFFHVNGRFVRYLNPFFCHWDTKLCNTPRYSKCSLVWDASMSSIYSKENHF